LREWGLVNALADPQETGGPYPGDDPDPPRTRAWTHRFRAEGRTSYELFDQMWLSPDLADRQTGAWIHRRTTAATTTRRSSPSGCSRPAPGLGCSAAVAVHHLHGATPDLRDPKKANWSSSALRS
jgi:hypothetical protein